VKVVEVNGEKVAKKTKGNKSKSGVLITPPDIAAVQNYFLEL